MAGVCKHAGPAAGEGSIASDFGPVVQTVVGGLRALLWTLPPESDPAEFRTHGGRLR